MINSFADLYVVGIYYQPEMEFDYVILDIRIALNKMPNSCHSIVAGDCNINENYPRAPKKSLNC